MTAKRAHWGSRMAFILATAGSAIGLGNIWKFPYVAGTNGGGYFVLIYLFCVAVVGIPVMISELYIGQQAQTDAVDAFEKLDKKKTWWQIPGWLGLASAFLILSFYSVVGGWILDFEVRSLFNEFSSLNDDEVKGLLGKVLADPVRQTIWHLVFMALCMGIVVKGVSGGLERMSKILMPALFVMLLGLLVHSFFLDGFSQAMSFMFSTQHSSLNANGIVEAVGQAFFSLSLGMGVIITYGSYLDKNINLVKMSLTVAFLDTFMAILAGVIIFSVVFSFGLNPGAGPGLIFGTLPMLFNKLPGGTYLAIIFFLLVTFAAITSAVSILEVVVAHMNDRYKFSRKKSTLIMGLSCLVLGLLAVFSNNILADFKMFGLTFFDLFDKLTSSYFLPLGGMGISLFFGWKLGPAAVERVTGSRTSIYALGLLWLTRLIAPLGILAVFYNQAIGF